jgi:hypothetical protein
MTAQEKGCVVFRLKYFPRATRQPICIVSISFDVTISFYLSFLIRLLFLIPPL